MVFLVAPKITLINHNLKLKSQKLTKETKNYQKYNVNYLMIYQIKGTCRQIDSTRAV